MCSLSGREMWFERNNFFFTYNENSRIDESTFSKSLTWSSIELVWSWMVNKKSSQVSLECIPFSNLQYKPFQNLQYVTIISRTISQKNIIPRLL